MAVAVPDVRREGRVERDRETLSKIVTKSNHAVCQCTSPHPKLLFNFYSTLLQLGKDMISDHL